MIDRETSESEESYPWPDVEAARKNARLQGKHPISEGQARHLHGAKACPKCGVAAERLAWLYFESPEGTWELLCGRAGWMTVCDECHVQVDFFLEILS
jgi:hypothetical protein